MTNFQLNFPNSCIFVGVADKKAADVIQAIRRIGYNAGDIKGGTYTVAVDCKGRRIGEIRAC